MTWYRFVVDLRHHWWPATFHLRDGQSGQEVNQVHYIVKKLKMKLPTLRLKCQCGGQAFSWRAWSNTLLPTPQPKTLRGEWESIQACTKPWQHQLTITTSTSRTTRLVLMMNITQMQAGPQSVILPLMLLTHAWTSSTLLTAGWSSYCTTNSFFTVPLLRSSC